MFNGVNLIPVCAYYQPVYGAPVENPVCVA